MKTSKQAKELIDLLRAYEKYLSNDIISLEKTLKAQKKNTYSSSDYNFLNGGLAYIRLLRSYAEIREMMGWSELDIKARTSHR